MAKLLDVEGIGPVNAEKLKKAGVGSTDSLLSMGGTAAGRKDLAKKSGVSEKLLLEWVNHVDLFRIKGVGEEYADLLEEAGRGYSCRTGPAQSEQSARQNDRSQRQEKPGQQNARPIPGGGLGCPGQETAPRSLVLSLKSLSKIGGSTGRLFAIQLAYSPGLL